MNLRYTNEEMAKAQEENRYAYFIIYQDMPYELQAKALSLVEIRDARWRYEARGLEVLGVSPMFDKVPYGDLAPWVMTKTVRCPISGKPVDVEFGDSR